MNIKLFFFISKFEIKIYYLDEKDVKQYLYQNENITPLCFYSNNIDFQIGKSAYEKFKGNIKHSYYNYFDSIEDKSLKFTFLDSKDYPISKLLQFGIEYIIDSFISDKLEVSGDYKSLAHLIDLHLISDVDLSTKDVNTVKKLFSNHNFSSLSTYFLDHLVLHMKMNKDFSYENYLFVKVLNNNIYLSFTKSQIDEKARNVIVGKNLAINPKYKIIAEQLFYDTVEKFGANVRLENELPNLLEITKKHYKEDEFEYRIPAQLSDNGPINNVLINAAYIEERVSRINYSDDFSFLTDNVSVLNLSSIDIGVIVFGNIHSDKFLTQVKSTYKGCLKCDNDNNDIIQFLLDNKNIPLKDDKKIIEKSSSKQEEVVIAPLEEKSEKINKTKKVNKPLPPKVKPKKILPPPLPKSVKIKPPPLPKK